MINPQQPASPVRAEEQLAVVMLDTVRYKELLDAERFLNALRSSGVDNWDGYDYAISEWEDEGFDDGL